MLFFMQFVIINHITYFRGLLDQQYINVTRVLKDLRWEGLAERKKGKDIQRQQIKNKN